MATAQKSLKRNEPDTSHCSHQKHHWWQTSAHLSPGAKGCLPMTVDLLARKGSDIARTVYIKDNIKVLWFHYPLPLYQGHLSFWRIRVFFKKSSSWGSCCWRCPLGQTLHMPQQTIAEGAVLRANLNYKTWCFGSKEDKTHFSVTMYAFRVIAIKHYWFHIS